MRKLMICMFLTMCSLSGLMAQPPAVDWSHVYGGTGFDSMWNLIPAAGGRYLIVGVTTSFGAGLDDVWIVLTDAAGQTIWSKTYGTANYEGCTYCIQTSDGGFAAVGWTASGSSDATVDAWLIKLNANGDSTWSRVFGGADGDYPYWVEQTPDGGYIVCGTTRSSGAGGWDGWLVKLDGGGAIQWQRTYGGSGSDYFISVVPVADGYVTCGDETSTGAGGWDSWLFKTNLSGDSVWSRTFGTADNEDSYAMQRTGDGGFFLVGDQYVSGNDSSGQWYVIKTNSLGIADWTRTYGGAGFDAAWQGEQLADGGYIIGGFYQYADSGSADLAATKIAANGDSVWTLRFYGDGDDYGWFAHTTPDGGYLLGADSYSSWSAGDADWLVVKTQSICDDETPAAPNVVIDQVGSNVQLHWAPVTQSVTGCQISASHYLVFYSPTFAGPYYYHGYTADTVYTHWGVIAYAPGQFYHVIASTAPIPTLMALPSVEANATESDVLAVLRAATPPVQNIVRLDLPETKSPRMQVGPIQSPRHRMIHH